MTLDQYKNLFSRTDKLHLNNAGLSPIMKPAYEEIQYWAKRFYDDGFYSDHDYMAKVDWTRQQIANFIDCDKQEIAFFQSSAWGISQFAFGIQLKENDEVILFDQEYSSNLYPWQQACKKNKAKLVVIDTDNSDLATADSLIEKISDKTKVIAVSYVQFQSGILLDLEKISKVCQQKNILFFVDVMQALGMHPISFKKLAIDGLVCGSHKWLNAPVGAAFLAIKKELALSMQPIAVGSGTYGTCDDPSDFACAPKLDATKFEAGSKQVLEICAMGRSIETIQKVGIDIIRNEAYRLAEILKNEIKKLNFTVTEHRVSYSKQFVHFSTKKDDKDLQLFLNQKGIHLPVRGAGIRVTPHGFNTDADCEQFLQILKQYKK